MADDGILPLLLLAGAGYVAWKYFAPSVSGAPTSAATSTPPTPPVQNSTYGPAAPAQIIYPPDPTAPPPARAYYAAATLPPPPAAAGNIFSSLFQTPAPTSNRGTAILPGTVPTDYTMPMTINRASFGGNTPMPDDSHILDKPQPMVIPVYIPPVSPAWTPEQEAFGMRCSTLWGNPIPGCV